MFSVSLSHSNLDRSDAAGTVHNRRVPSELLDTRWSPRELNATLATPESWPGSGSPIGSMAVRPGATVVIHHCDADAAAGEFRLLAARLIAAFGGDHDAAADHWPTQCRPRSRARWPSNSRQARPTVM